MKLHLGCGRRVLPGFVNIDRFVEEDGVENHDILNLPYPDGSVSLILAEHMIEHLPFQQEEAFWREAHRLLKPGGVLEVEVPDMEWLCRAFLEGKDDFREFYKVGAADHYFGNGRAVDQRWGIITTHFFGNQNGPGQFHHCAYTEAKLKRVSAMIGFSNCDVQTLFNKGAQCLRAHIVK